MTISRNWIALITTAFVAVDIILSILFLIWNDRIAGRYIYYDFRTSQLDLGLLVLIRTAILIGGLIGVCWRSEIASERAQSSSLYVVCVCLTMGVYSPLKLLALAETTDDFRRLYWFWSLFVWNIFASTVCSLVWSNIFTNVAVPQSKTLVVDANGDRIGDGGTDRLVENDILENNIDQESMDADGIERVEKKEKKDEEKKLDVKETTSLFWRIIKYTRREWLWYTLGFVFLLFYSLGKF
jgi:hypothetical protein